VNRKVDVTLLGFTLPDVEMESIFQRDPAMPTQTHAFAWAVVRALQSAGLNVGLLSTEPVSNFPRMPRLLFRGHSFVVGEAEGKSLSFVNILGVKHVTRFISCIVSGRTVLRQWRPRVLLVHGVHSPFLWYGVIARRFGVRTVIIVTDPPGVIHPTDGPISRVLKLADVRLVRAALARVDGVVALTEQLALDYAKGRPFLVMEGIHSGQMNELRPAASGRDLSIVYAGNLAAASGVDRLILAVEGLEDIHVSLKIYGKGELAEWIDGRAKRDARVRPVEFAPRSEVMSAYLRADLLVQPRPMNQPVGRYSFPSKLVEYMASGTPVLTTRLEGVPAEYEPYVYWIDDDSAEGIRIAIRTVLAIPAEERRKKGEFAAAFVHDQLSSATQGARFRRFFELI